MFSKYLTAGSLTMSIPYINECSLCLLIFLNVLCNVWSDDDLDEGYKLKHTGFMIVLNITSVVLTSSHCWFRKVTKFSDAAPHPPLNTTLCLKHTDAFGVIAILSVHTKTMEQAGERRQRNIR